MSGSIQHGEWLTVPSVLLCFSGDPDYKMQCVGYWRENLRSYLITYDELDPISKYRCWVSTAQRVRIISDDSFQGVIMSLPTTDRSAVYDLPPNIITYEA